MLSPDELDELAAAFVTMSRALVAIAVRSIESAPVDVTTQQFRVLVFLSAEGPQGVGAIALQLAVNPSNATRICDRLQRLKLIERTPSTKDGRVVRVSITRAGRRLVDTVLKDRRRQVAEVLQQMAPMHVPTVVAALGAFNEAAHEREDTDWRSTRI
jgi:DNA-binding MarR family transcriptional regulator